MMLKFTLQWNIGLLSSTFIFTFEHWEQQKKWWRNDSQKNVKVIEWFISAKLGTTNAWIDYFGKAHKLQESILLATHLKNY